MESVVRGKYQHVEVASVLVLLLVGRIGLCRLGMSLRVGSRCRESHEEVYDSANSVSAIIALIVAHIEQESDTRLWCAHLKSALFVDFWPRQLSVYASAPFVLSFSLR